MMDWDQLQAEVLDHVSVMCRDQILRSPPRKVYSQTYGTTVTLSPLLATRLPSSPTQSGPDTGTISWNTGRIPLADASNTTVHQKGKQLDGEKLTDVRLLIQETESRLFDEINRVWSRSEERLTDGGVRGQANKLAIDRLALDIEALGSRTQVVEERATRLGDTHAAQESMMQRIEGAQARQAALNNQLTTHADEATHRVSELEEQVSSLQRALQRKADRQDVDELTAQLKEHKDGLSAGIHQASATAKGSQDGLRALRVLSRAVGLEGHPSSLDHIRNLIDNNEWTQVQLPLLNVASLAGHQATAALSPHRAQFQARSQLDAEVDELLSRDVARRLGDVNQRLIDLDVRLSGALEEEKKARHLRIQECREDVLAAQGHKEASLKREMKALETTMHSDTAELRHLLESQGRVGKVLEEQCASLDRWIQTMEQHMGRESKDMSQLRLEMSKRIDDAYTRLETQLSDVARVEREHRLNGFKELGKELHDVLHMQTTLEGKVQRCQFEIAKSTNNSNDLRCKLDDAVELSRATASRLHEALEAFHKLHAQQDSIRHVIEMTAGVMVTMSQRTAELAGAPPLPTHRPPFAANVPSGFAYDGRGLGPAPPLPSLGSEQSGHHSSYSSYGGDEMAGPRPHPHSSPTVSKFVPSTSLPPPPRRPSLQASALSATAPLPSTPSPQLMGAEGEGEGRHHRTLPSEVASVIRIRNKGMYRGESMDSASDAGRRRAASEEAGTSTGTEEEEENDEAVRLSRVGSAGSQMATDEERLAARVSFDRDWGGRNHLQSLEDEVGDSEGSGGSSASSGSEGEGSVTAASVSQGDVRRDERRGSGLSVASSGRRARFSLPLIQAMDGEEEEEEEQEEEEEEEEEGEQQQEDSSFDEEDDEEGEEEEEEEEEEGQDAGPRASVLRVDEDFIPTARAGMGRAHQQEVDNCRQCLKSFPRDELEQHMQEHCRLRYVTCHKCTQQVRFLNLESHVITCRGVGGKLAPLAPVTAVGGLRTQAPLPRQHSNQADEDEGNGVLSRFNAQEVAPQVKTWNRKQLHAWLSGLGLEETAQILYEYRIDGSCFLILTDWELENAEEGLGIQDVRLREQVLEVIEALVKADPDSSSGSSATGDSGAGKKA